MQLPEAGAVSLLRPRLQARQVIAHEPFEGISITVTWAPATIQPTMIFHHSCKILLGDGSGRGMSRSPDLLASPLEANPVDRIAFIDVSHERYRLRFAVQRGLHGVWFLPNWERNTPSRSLRGRPTFSVVS